MSTRSNSVIRGTTGADTLTGTSGDDIFVVDHISDVVIENADGGNDIVILLTPEYKGVFDNIEAVRTAFAPSGNYSDLPWEIPDDVPFLSRMYFGTDEANRLEGGTGNDLLNGKLGRDVLTGNTGEDAFVFDSKLGKNNIDKVTDFAVADDTILLDNAVFKQLVIGSDVDASKLRKEFFTIGKQAKDKNDYLIYDSKSGALLYDADGSGEGKAVKFAQLDSKLKLTVDDFQII